MLTELCQRTCLVNILLFPLLKRDNVAYFDGKNHLTASFPWQKIRKGWIYPSSMALPEIYHKQATIYTGAQYKKIQQYLLY